MCIQSTCCVTTCVPGKIRDIEKIVNRWLPCHPRAFTIGREIRREYGDKGGARRAGGKDGGAGKGSGACWRAWGRGSVGWGRLSEVDEKVLGRL